MLNCEMDIFESIDNMLMNDSELMAELEADIYEEIETNDCKQSLYEVLTSQVDADISEITLSVYIDNIDVKVYRGKADLYPYDYDTSVIDYSVYNIFNKVYIDAWI